MTPEKQAALIAEWLDKPPGTPPPEGVDPDAIETIFALSPQRAPAPRVSIDDILAGVGSGPFFENKVAELPLAQAAPAPVAEEPEEPQHTQVIDLAARRRRRIWGGVGVAAMAALVLFSVVPEQGFDELAEAPMPAEQQAAPTGATAEPAAVIEQLRDSGERQQAKPATAKSEALPPAPPTDGLEGKIQPSSGRYDELQLSSGGASSSYGEDPAPRAAPAQELQDYAGNTADEVDRGAFEEAEEAQVASRVADLTSSGATSQAAYEALSDDEQAPSKQKRAEDRRRTRGEPSSRPSSSSAVAELDMEPSADDWDDTPAEIAPIPTDLDGLRAAAVPGDYGSSWYLKALSDDELARFDKAIETGTESDLISDPNARIGQDMAFRAAKLALAAGADAEALRYTRQGQARSSANTAFLSNLYYIEGRVLERQGDTEGAKRAYTAAANLNRAR